MRLLSIFVWLLCSSAYAGEVQVPRECRVPNRTGSQCVWSSTETLARYHKIERLYVLTSRHGGTAGPEEVESVLRTSRVRCRVLYPGTRRFDWLRDSIDKGYPVAVGLSGQHMVTLTGLDDQHATIIDNMDRKLEPRRWPIQRFRQAFDGFAVALIPDHVKE